MRKRTLSKTSKLNILTALESLKDLINIPVKITKSTAKVLDIHQLRAHNVTTHSSQCHPSGLIALRLMHIQFCIAFFFFFFFKKFSGSLTASETNIFCYLSKSYHRLILCQTPAFNLPLSFNKLLKSRENKSI
jgi:hypothetical protein